MIGPRDKEGRSGVRLPCRWMPHSEEPSWLHLDVCRRGASENDAYRMYQVHVLPTEDFGELVSCSFSTWDLFDRRLREKVELKRKMRCDVGFTYGIGALAMSTQEDPGYSKPLVPWVFMAHCP